jgi:hypothetical protein
MKPAKRPLEAFLSWFTSDGKPSSAAQEASAVAKRTPHNSSSSSSNSRGTSFEIGAYYGNTAAAAAAADSVKDTTPEAAADLEIAGADSAPAADDVAATSAAGTAGCEALIQHRGTTLPVLPAESEPTPYSSSSSSSLQGALPGVNAAPTTTAASSHAQPCAAASEAPSLAKEVEGRVDNFFYRIRTDAWLRTAPVAAADGATADEIRPAPFIIAPLVSLTPPPPPSDHQQQCWINLLLNRTGPKVIPAATTCMAAPPLENVEAARPA